MMTSSSQSWEANPQAKQRHRHHPQSGEDQPVVAEAARQRSNQTRLGNDRQDANVGEYKTGGSRADANFLGIKRKNSLEGGKSQPIEQTHMQ